MAEPKRISPINDLMFKKLMASVEHKDILSGIIVDVLGIVPEDLKIVSPYSIELCKALVGETDINKLRHTLRDIAATFKSGDYVSELQIRKTRHFHERLAYYPMKRYCENYGDESRITIKHDGERNLYESLRPVYALNILEQSHYDDDDALRVFELYDPVRNKGFGKDILKIGCFELKKVNIETENQKHWCDFFMGREISANAPDYIKKASEVVNFANLGEEERQVAEAIEKASATLQDELDYSYYAGMEKGEEKGILKGASDVLNLLKSGKSLEEIAKNMGIAIP
ncbi:MAG: Rpn family recombination-promoting nuclease/putative transposase [Oscillospiraceae bacterium]|nr:Rpn family recombination-promoting nuclease/putative transposase [Oscillospiraceae bacterium]